MNAIKQLFGLKQMTDLEVWSLDWSDGSSHQ